MTKMISLSKTYFTKSFKLFFQLSLCIIVLASLLNCASNPKIESGSKLAEQNKPPVKMSDAPASPPPKPYHPPPQNHIGRN